jgi:hypothetical protein
VKLLADLQKIWPSGEEQCETSTLLTRLKELEESPWGDFGLSSRKLADMLRPFKVQSRELRSGKSVLRGYKFSQLEAAFLRYMPFGSATSATRQ